MFNRMKMMLAVALGSMLGRTPASLHRIASDHNRTVDAMRALGSAATIGRRLRAGATRLVPTRYRRSTLYLGRNGAQECARRMRQIERGQLKGSNGLLYEGTGITYCVDSHGRPAVWPY